MIYMLYLASKHHLRCGFHLRMNIVLPKMGIQIFQTQSFGLRIHKVDQEEGEDVEGHEDEESTGTNMSYSDGPDLTNDDGSNRSSRSSDAQPFRSDVGGEYLCTF
jgi:hypothetical protein